MRKSFFLNSFVRALVCLSDGQLVDDMSVFRLGTAQ